MPASQQFFFLRPQFPGGAVVNLNLEKDKNATQRREKEKASRIPPQAIV